MWIDALDLGIHTEYFDVEERLGPGRLTLLRQNNGIQPRRANPFTRTPLICQHQLPQLCHAQAKEPQSHGSCSKLEFLIPLLQIGLIWQLIDGSPHSRKVPEISID